MTKITLIVAIKCSVILYFTACTGIDKMTTTVSASPHVTRGAWKVNLYTESKNDETFEFDDCMLTFETSGKIVAYKNGKKITGNWAEDNISKKVTINLETKDPALSKLNDNWTISTISKWQLNFENTSNPTDRKLQITSL
jgi:hypothetical protein